MPPIARLHLRTRHRNSSAVLWRTSSSRDSCKGIPISGIRARQNRRPRMRATHGLPLILATRLALAAHSRKFMEPKACKQRLRPAHIAERGMPNGIFSCATCGRSLEETAAWKGNGERYYCNDFCAEAEAVES